MVDYEFMIAWDLIYSLSEPDFFNFLLSKLSRDFKLCGMSTLQVFQRAIFLYCFMLKSHRRVYWYSPICTVHGTAF